MKSKFILLATCVAIIITAQSCMTFKVFVGGQMADITGGESWEPRAGAQAGVGASIAEFSDNMGLGAEAGISLQGAAWEEMGFKGSVDLIYLNVPVLFRYQSQKGFYGEAGIQPGFLLSAKDKYEGESYDFIDEMNKFDLGVPVGIGYLFRNNIGINLRVVPGLTDITKDEDEKDSNLVFSLGLSYRFGKK